MPATHTATHTAAPAATVPPPTPASGLLALRHFIGRNQSRVRAHLANHSEEAAYFAEVIATFVERVRTMPHTYQQDGKGDEAVAHLHYFVGGCDFYITEKDRSPDDGQHQAFGLTSLGFEPELGYINVPEILSAGAELDLHFTPKTLREIRIEKDWT